MKNGYYLIVGLGKTGFSIARYLTRNNKSFVVFDTRASVPLIADFKQEFPGIKVYLQTIPPNLLDEIQEIIVSPGVSLDIPLFKEAQLRDIAFYGDIECLAREIHAPIIAITGTNGKSTVTCLVGEMAKTAGINTVVAGNIGDPVLDRLADKRSAALWILELSSFQLDLSHSLKPLAATILNISEDHLDRHHTMDAYIQAKQRIYREAQTIVFNREDHLTFPTEIQNAISFGLDHPSSPNWGLITEQDVTYLAHGEEKIIATETLKIQGLHNYANALAACALADLAGISKDAIIQTLSNFSGLAHRCQWVRSLNGVDWINDSKGTNIGATISAIKGIGGSLQGKIVLIAGGQGKGADFNELQDAVSEFARDVIIIGEDAAIIETALAPIVATTRASSLDEAVKIAGEKAKFGDVVLLSPACASLDMFRDFNHRGESFTALVQGL